MTQPNPLKTQIFDPFPTQPNPTLGSTQPTDIWTTLLYRAVSVQELILQHTYSR